MTYSTGSGDYNALMAAVLAHAVADGWTTSAGNWPINKGNVRGVAWSTFTATEADRTFLGGATKTARYVRIAIGTSTANATANAAITLNCAVVANMEYTFTSWHIFSDPATCDYIHVVANFSNGVNGDVYTHFSFGELDKHGMTHTAVVYATSSSNRGYSVDTSSGNQSADWNSGPYGITLHPYSGSFGYTYTKKYNYNNMVYIIDPTVNPLPGSGWPTANTLNDRDTVLDVVTTFDSALTGVTPAIARNGLSLKWASWIPFTTPQPYSGALSMMSLPFFILQGILPSSSTILVGSFPNVRACSMETYEPQSIVSYGSDDWMIFPMLRSTLWSQVQVTDAITSGRSGYAFKKVP